MKFCYADPPYPGMSHFYRDDPRCAEVDHAELIARIDGEYESWALSTASVTLKQVLAVSPPDVRIGSWVKTFASFKPGINPAYAWEPVIFKTPNRNDKTATTVRDWIDCSITLERGLVGAKPERFCFWLFGLLGATPDDDLVDLYPGSGAVTIAWEKWCGRKAGRFTTGNLFAGVK